MMYIILSTMLYLWSQMGTVGSIFAAFTWLVPLIMSEKLWTIRRGFVWGILIFTIHFSWLLAMMFDHGIGLQGCMIWLITVMWFSSGAALWLYGTKYSWSISTLLFFTFLTQWSLLPCGVQEGYPLSNPLLPLACSKPWLWIVQAGGDFLGWCCLILVAKVLAYFLQYCCSLNIRIFIVLFLFFFVEFLNMPTSKSVADDMVYVQPWWYGCKNPMFAAYRMVDALNECPQKRCIIMPESTFCFNMNEYEHFVPIWSENLDEVIIIFGAHRQVQKDMLNSIFVLKQGKIEKIYDKAHRMPLVEKVSYCFDMIGLGQCFITSKNQDHTTMLQVCSYDDLVDINGQIYQLFICSELFFEAKSVKGYPILLLWNESWLFFEWTKKLAVTYIDYFSIKYHVKVVYASTQGRSNF